MKMFTSNFSRLCLVLIIALILIPGQSQSQSSLHFADYIDNDTSPYNDFVLVPDNAALGLAGTFTIEAWVSPSDDIANTIFDKGTYWCLFQLHQGFGLYRPGMGWMRYPGTIPQNEWSHVAVTFDEPNNQIIFYLDGEIFGQITDPKIVSPAPNNGPAGIGRQDPAAPRSNVFNGKMDEFRIWDIVRSPGEIRALYDKSVTFPVAGLVANYHFDEGSGTRVNDDSGNNLTGTLTNKGNIRSLTWITDVPVLGIASPPPTVLTQNITVQLDVNGEVTITPEQVDGGTVDISGPFSLSLDRNTFTCSSTGENVVTLSATNMSGLTSTGTAIVSVEDILPPVFQNCPEDILVDADEGEEGAVVSFTTPTVSEACPVLVSQTFGYSGSQETFIVPPGITSIDVVVVGASGGKGFKRNQMPYGTPGLGGLVSATLSVEPGQILYLNVGGEGGLAYENTPAVGGYNGGGNGGTKTNNRRKLGGAGGGASDIRINGDAFQNRIIVAGGGGGVGYQTGGNGGGENGADGAFLSGYPAYGGTQSKGGNGGTYYGYWIGGNGGFGFGGHGANGLPASYFGGGGGGGGWYGGGGSSYYGDGAGGSSYFDPGSANVLSLQGVQEGNGYIIISYSPEMVVQTEGLPAGSLFPIGTTAVSFSATDGAGNTSSCSFNVTVENANEPPLADAGEDQTINCAPITGVDVNLDGSGSSDPDEDELTYSWSNGATGLSPTVTIVPGIHTITLTVDDGNGETATDELVITVNADIESPVIEPPEIISLNNDPGACGAIYTLSPPVAYDNCGIATLENDAPGEFPVGSTTVTWTATDIHANFSTVTQDVIVLDIENPVLETSIAVITLWPPNHKYKNISIDDFGANAFDNCGLSPDGIIIGRVTSDEPEDAKGGGDGNTKNDIVIADGCTSVDLRAERQGGGNGRVYTITLVVKDQAGNQATAQCYVHIPHDRKGIAVDDGIGSGYTVDGICGDIMRIQREIIIKHNNILTEDNLQIKNYPNPFKDETRIKYSVSTDCKVILDIYNIEGKKVRNLVSNNTKAGVYTVKWKGSDNSGKPLPGGIYLARIIAANQMKSITLVISR